jgi:hypothetical protein
MASWMVHLRLAEDLCRLIEGVDEAYFAIGNVAPDSGVPDEKWEKFDPPSKVTHFHLPEGSLWGIADLVFFRQFLAPALGRQANIQERSFLLGYFFHLVTDNLWSAEIGRPTREKFREQFEADPQFIWEVKRDWYGLDFAYARMHPEALYWRTFLVCDYEQEFLPFLPGDAIRQNLAYIREFYQRTDEKVETWYIQRPDNYLSEAEMECFLQETTARLHSIYKHLCLDNVDTAAFSTALEMALPPITDKQY